DRLKRELRRAVREGCDGDAMLRIGRLCQEAGMDAEARDWFELAGRRDPRHRPRGLDPGPRAPGDDAPAVALSRPVLNASPPRPPSERSPRITAQTQPGPRLEDIAERSGVRFRYESGATPQLFIGDTMGGGVALFDY